MFDRFTPASQPARSRARPAVFAGPTRGWIKNQSLAAKVERAAERLDNFFPTPEGARMRAGSAKQATIDAAVTELMVYDTGATQKLFAADATSIYDVTSPADPDVAVTASVTGQTSGNWSYVQFATSAGSFLVAVNGSDDEQIYDGVEWYPVGSSDVEILSYDAQTGEFTEGLTITGASSGATAKIIRIADNGTSGDLTIVDRSGTFSNNETITDTSTGSADVDGSPTTKYTGITGANSSAMSHVWAFKKRLFFIEGGTLSAWYLGTLAIGGSLTEFPLQGLFRRGGSLLFGATWSQDAGDGLDDFCVFATTEGEVAVYQGTDPASWSLVGIYQMGKPLSKNAHFRAGGDLGILCDDGIIPLSSALNKTGAALAGDAITFPIEDEWRDIIRDRKGVGTFSATLWHNETALMVGIPTPAGFDDIMLVANSRTGAWCRYTGWGATSVATLNDAFYFGTADGTVVQGETGGSDVSANYSAVWVPRFDTLGAPVEKAALHARVLGRTENPISQQLFANADYVIDVPTPLAADASIVTDTWGSGEWGTSIWAGGRSTETVSAWQAVSGCGVALAPGLQVTSGRSTAPTLDVIALHLLYEPGQVMG